MGEKKQQKTGDYLNKTVKPGCEIQDQLTIINTFSLKLPIANQKTIVIEIDMIHNSNKTIKYQKLI